MLNVYVRKYNLILNLNFVFFFILSLNLKGIFYSSTSKNESPKFIDSQIDCCFDVSHIWSLKRNLVKCSVCKHKPFPGLMDSFLTMKKWINNEDK